jgi:hypothetical protein
MDAHGFYRTHSVAGKRNAIEWMSEEVICGNEKRPRPARR